MRRATPRRAPAPARRALARTRGSARRHRGSLLRHAIAAVYLRRRAGGHGAAPQRRQPLGDAVLSHYDSGIGGRFARAHLGHAGTGDGDRAPARQLCHRIAGGSDGDRGSTTTPPVPRRRRRRLVHEHDVRKPEPDSDATASRCASCGGRSVPTFDHCVKPAAGRNPAPTRPTGSCRSRRTAVRGRSSARRFGTASLMWPTTSHSGSSSVCSLAGAIAVFVPNDLASRGFGSGIVPMIALLIAGIPLYMCASASTPIAAALVAKGISPGRSAGVPAQPAQRAMP